jgi:hypothetical protein
MGMTVDPSCRIWVLFEFEDDQEDAWRGFRSKEVRPPREQSSSRCVFKIQHGVLIQELADFIRRDSGEPIRLPPPCLSPDASEGIVRPRP